MSVPLRVLIVEDSHKEALSMIGELTRSGYEVSFERVDNALAMRTALEKQPWDIVLSGCSMVNFSAAAALESLRTAGLDIPFIVIAASNKEETAVALVKSGAHDYVIKENLIRLGPVVARGLADITLKRKTALIKNKLEEERIRFKELFNTMSSGVAIFEPLKGGQDFIFKDINKSVEVIDRVKRKDVLGKSICEVFPAVKEFGLFEVLQRVYLTSTPEHFPLAFYKDQRVSGWRDNYVLKFSSGEVIAIYDDVTGREKAERLLRENEKKFKLLYEHAPLGYQSLDANGCLTEVNAAWLSLLGYSKKEVIGRWLGDFMAPHSQELFKERFPLFKIRGETHNNEYEMVHKDGAHVIVSLDGKISRDERGNFAHTHCIFHDITQAKEIEATVRRSHAFRKLVLTLSSSFINLELAALDERCTDALKQLGLFINADYSALFRFYDDEQCMYLTHEWCSEKITSYKDTIQKMPMGQFPWFMQIMTKHEVFSVENVDRLPQEAAAEKELFRSLGLRSAIAIPLVSRDSLIGFIGFAKIINTQPWEDDIAVLLKVTADMFANLFSRAESELRLFESEEKYRTLIQNLNVGIYRNTAGPRSRFLQANPALLRMYGYDSPEEFLHIDVADLYETPGERQSFIDEISKKGSVKNKELQLKKKDGSLMWCAITATAKRDEHGAIEWIDGMVEDITERKNAEIALQASRDYLDKIINAIGDPVFVKDRQSRFVLVNDALCAFLGRLRQEIVGKTDYDFFPKGQVDVFLQHDKIVFETGREDANEETITDAQGMVHTIVTKKTVYMDAAGNKSLVGVIRDITERKRVEQALRESEEKLRLIFENTKEGIVILNENGTFEFFNKAVAQNLGYTEDEFRSVTMADIEAIESKEGFAAHHRDALHETRTRFETKQRKKDGSLMYVEVSLSTLDFKGEKRVCGVWRDITERKIAEEALRFAYQRLKETQDQLMQSTKVASIGLLAGEVAHEINNPLSGVLNNAQLIRMLAIQKKDFNFNDFNELVKAMEEGAQRCVSITRALLEFSRASKGVFKNVSLNEIIEKVVIISEQELKLENITLQKQLASGLPLVFGDPQLLAQVVIGIISNAKWAIHKKNMHAGTIVIQTVHNVEEIGRA
ncbi:MAG: PAS domain S-box protein, partial [Candidatus Omnitrophica bacterium]|nr:PAS domain S-box protein [Candidatus Omnitrophota bacterium]